MHSTNAGSERFPPTRGAQLVPALQAFSYMCCADVFVTGIAHTFPPAAGFIISQITSVRGRQIKYKEYGGANALIKASSNLGPGPPSSHPLRNHF